MPSLDLKKKSKFPRAAFLLVTKSRTFRSGRLHEFSTQRLVRRVIRSPNLKRVFCRKSNFSFKKKSTYLARLNRAELGEFDALMLGLMLTVEFKCQLVIPYFGFYLRPFHNH